MYYSSKGPGSDSKIDIWSFDKIINKSSKLYWRCVREFQKIILPINFCKELNSLQLRSTPLLVLPLSKLIENTTKYIQNKLYVDKFGQNYTSNCQFFDSYEVLQE